MNTHNGERSMTEAQRDEIKRLCLAAEIPGELYTEESAQALIEDLRSKASTGSSGAAGHRHSW